MRWQALAMAGGLLVMDGLVCEIFLFEIFLGVLFLLRSLTISVGWGCREVSLVLRYLVRVWRRDF